MTCEPVLAGNGEPEVYETTILICEENCQECCHFNIDLSSIHGGLPVCCLGVSAMVDYISVSCLLRLAMRKIAYLCGFGTSH